MLVLWLLRTAVGGGLERPTGAGDRTGNLSVAMAPSVAPIDAEEGSGIPFGKPTGTAIAAGLTIVDPCVSSL